MYILHNKIKLKNLVNNVKVIVTKNKKGENILNKYILLLKINVKY